MRRAKVGDLFTTECKHDKGARDEFYGCTICAQKRLDALLEAARARLDAPCKVCGCTEADVGMTFAQLVKRWSTEADARLIAENERYRKALEEIAALGSGYTIKMAKVIARAALSPGDNAAGS